LPNFATPEVVNLTNAFSSAYRCIPLDGSKLTLGTIPKWCKFTSTGAIYNQGSELSWTSLRPSSFKGDHAFNSDPHYQQPPSTNTIKLYGKTAFIGHFMAHYGHFITEGLSRLWAFDQLSSYDHLVMYPFCSFSGKVSIKPFHHYIFRRLGIDVQKISFLSSPVWFENIDIFQQKWSINNEAECSLSKIYRYLTESLRVEDRGSRIFLSRGLNELIRHEGVQKIEDLFRKMNFKVIYPSEMCIQDQLFLYANCSVMAGFSGSGMHNFLFTRSGACGIEIGDKRTSDAPIRNQILVNSIAGNDYKFIKYVESCNADESYMNTILGSLMRSRGLR